MVSAGLFEVVTFGLLLVTDINIIARFVVVTFGWSVLGISVVCLYNMECSHSTPVRR